MIAIEIVRALITFMKLGVKRYCQPFAISGAQSCSYVLTSLAEGRALHALARWRVDETAGSEVQQTLELKPKRPHWRVGTRSEAVVVL